MNVVSLLKDQVGWMGPGEPWVGTVAALSVVRRVRGCQERLALALGQLGAKLSKMAETKRPAPQSLPKSSDLLSPPPEGPFPGHPEFISD